MRRSITVAAVLASLAVFAPAAVAVPVAQHTSARAAACHRTLKHYPVLRPGAHRPAVRTLQCVLNDDGYGPVVVDGAYGPQARAAVRRVENGFEGPAPHPGRINNGFWVLLFGQHLPDRDLSPGQHGPAIRTLQRALRAAGGRLAVTATFGARTRHVVRHYQRSQGVPVTGVVDERTRFFLAMGGVIGHQN
ncbi:peptidoglycan-binding protein [Marmoricola sp. URHB0036]|uniref:peptidoglycan-binding domain-containing protein n=1 Tax=Marmoricola sp. URHB0036 TaxID=1298863 RepID=UPI0004272F62|nr:peptidoglycan-binding protein [Marmoricola sp. URHB0036]